jgi:siroheme synthase
VSFVNGHQGEDGALPDWRFFADPQHTVVFYMGLTSLPEIVARLRAAGAGGDHPAALIAQATLPEQQIVRGTLADIVARARAQRLAAPALLIVGNVAAFAATTDASGFTALAGTPAVAAGALA